MYVCEKCGSELEEFNGKLFCKHAGVTCDFIILKSDYKQVVLPWNKRICNDNAYWHKPAFEKYPSIIAHEYSRLYDMIDKGETFGALLQLKDVFEVLIKLPTLVVASHIFHKKDRSDAENKIILNLLEKQLSLGDWKRIAQTTVDKVQTTEAITHILSNIVSIYQDIPAWRNEHIGHGALTFDEEVLQADIEKRLQSIQHYLAENEKWYEQLSLFMTDQNNILKELTGKNQARGLADEFTEIYIKYEGTQHTLYPYIFIEDGKIFFFDSFSRYNYRTSLLNYPEGVKRSNDQRINQVMKTIFTSANQTDQHLNFQEHSFEDDSYSLIEEKVTQKMQEVDDFERPEHLEKWLSQNVKKKNKGVFLLQMERGTGKTTFSRALDELSIGKIKLTNTSIRCHYINDSYAYKLKNFFGNLVDQLRMDRQGNNVISSIFQASEDAEDKKMAFAQMLNSYHKEHQKYFGKDKLLMVIDGLDEIPVKSNPSIYDFIPTADMLDNGVYLLLTSRMSHELSEFSRNRLRHLELSDQKVADKQDKEHFTTLEHYVKKHVFNTKVLSEEQKAIKDWMLDRSDCRFIYLKLLKDIYKMNMQDDFGSLPKGEELFDYYFNMLQSFYGEKFFKNIVNLLSIIATSYEPLTYREISKLMGEDKATFKLLAYLIDIRGFVNVERSFRGNLISISHEDWKKAIADKFQNSMKQLVSTWVDEQLIDEEILQTIDWAREENDGWTYLITYWYDYILDYRIAKCSAFEMSEYYSNALRNPSLYESKTIYRLLRRYGLQSKYLAVLKDYGDRDQVNVVEALAEVLIWRGHTLEKMAIYKDANQDYSEAIQFLRELKVQHKLDKALELADTLNDRGSVLNLMGNIDQALADYNEAIALINTMKQNGKNLSGKNISMALMNRGTIYVKKKCYAEALRDLNEAISQHRSFEGNDRTEDHFLAVALLNRGGVLKELNRNDGALEDFNESIDIFERLIESGELDEKDKYGIVLSNRGTVLSDMGRHQEALESYDHSIATFRKLEEEGQSFDRNTFAVALLNRGTLFIETGELEKAIQLYTESIAVREHLAENDLFYDWNDLAKVLINRGNAWRDIHSPREAFKDYTDAIAILANLYNEGKHAETDLFLDVLSNRGNLHYQLGEYKDSLRDFTASLNIIKKQASEGKLVDENKLASVRQNRGSVKFQLMEVSEALNDFTESVAIRRRLYQQGKLKTKSELAEVLLNLGAAYHDLGQYEEAVKTYTEAIEIWHGMSEAFEDPNLGVALLNRILSYREQGLIEKIIPDYNKYFILQGKRLKNGKEIDAKQLSSAISERLHVLQEYKITDGSLTDHTFAIDLIHTLILSQEIDDRTQLINLLMYRANMLNAMKRNAEAIQDYESAKELLKNTELKGNTNSKYFLAALLYNQGLTQLQAERFEEALGNFDEATTVLRKLSKKRNPQVGQLLAILAEEREELTAKLNS